MRAYVWTLQTGFGFTGLACSLGGWVGWLSAENKVGIPRKMSGSLDSDQEKKHRISIAVFDNKSSKTTPGQSLQLCSKVGHQPFYFSVLFLACLRDIWLLIGPSALVPNGRKGPVPSCCRTLMTRHQVQGLLTMMQSDIANCASMIYPMGMYCCPLGTCHSDMYDVACNFGCPPPRGRV